MRAFVRCTFAHNCVSNLVNHWCAYTACNLLFKATISVVAYSLWFYYRKETIIWHIAIQNIQNSDNDIILGNKTAVCLLHCTGAQGNCLENTIVIFPVHNYFLRHQNVSLATSASVTGWRRESLFMAAKTASTADLRCSQISSRHIPSGYGSEKWHVVSIFPI